LLFARVLRSPHAHARIRHLEASRAQALPGVHAVLTYENVPRIEWDDGVWLLDQEVRYHGDEVAVVAAESEAIAAEALRLIEVEFEVLPFTTDPEATLAPRAPRIWGTRSNLAEPRGVRARGDVRQGLRDAAVRVETTYRTQIAVHNSLEPHGTVAWWQWNGPSSGRDPVAPPPSGRGRGVRARFSQGDRAQNASLVVYESTQGTFNVRADLAKWLGLPLNRIQVITEHMGGGFGSKGSAGKHTLLAALLSRRTGRPVHLMLEREAENLAAGYRAGTALRPRLGRG
jgi:xanthine dehydrogenase YagR molybdenum-binding subunit